MSNEVEQNLIKIVKPILIGYIEGNMLKQFLKLDKDS
jgi:hypothetical protein